MRYCYLAHLEINFKADKQSTLKRTKNLIQSSLDDFSYEPGNLFQGGIMLKQNNTVSPQIKI